MAVWAVVTRFVPRGVGALIAAGVGAVGGSLLVREVSGESTE